MSLESLKSSKEELASSWQAKYNRLVDKVIYDVRIQNGHLMFYTTGDPEPLSLPLPAGGTGTGISTSVEDTDYSSNNFVVDGASHASAISSLDAILAALVPAPAESLGNKKLTINIPLYTALLSREAADGWSANGTLTPGQSFYGLIRTATYSMQSPNPSNTFKVGKKGAPIGVVAHAVNGADINTLAVSIAETSRTLNSSTMRVSSSPYNAVWQKGNVAIDYTQGNVYARHVLRHLDADNAVFGGETLGLELWYDALDISQVGINAVQVTESTAVIKQLSGISYYGKGTALMLTYNLTKIFQNCYHPVAVSRVTSGAFDEIVVNPTAVPRSTDIFFVTRTLNFSRDYSSGAALGQVTVTAFRPDGTNRSVNATLAQRVCAYNNVATALVEYFLDESYRLLVDSTTPFNSALMPNGEAQVRNGVLVYGNEDYLAKSGAQGYQRFILKNPASNGSVTLGGITRSQISPYGSGDLNLLLKLESGVYFDLAVSFGFGGDGTSPQTARGGRADNLCTATTTAFTFGQLSTSDSGNGGKYRLLVRLRDTIVGRTLSVSNIITT